MSDRLQQAQQEQLLAAVMKSPTGGAALTASRSGYLWLQPLGGAGPSGLAAAGLDGGGAWQQASSLARGGGRGGGGGGSGSGAVRLLQKWKRRYFILSDECIEYYREVEPEAIGGRTRAVRAARRKLADLASVERSGQHVLLLRFWPDGTVRHCLCLVFNCRRG